MFWNARADIFFISQPTIINEEHGYSKVLLNFIYTWHIKGHYLRNHFKGMSLDFREGIVVKSKLPQVRNVCKE